MFNVDRFVGSWSQVHNKQNAVFRIGTYQFQGTKSMNR